MPSLVFHLLSPCIGIILRFVRKSFLIIKFAIVAALILVTQPCFAEQVFTLKDGSIIKGSIISYAQGVYAVQSQQLGRLQIPAENVVSVTNAASQSQPARQQTPSSSPSASSLSPAATQQMTDVQNQIMADPALMQEVEKMAKDKEMSALLADPALKNELMNALRSNDPRMVENNPKLKKILQNPYMQNVLKQMSSGATFPSR